MSVNISWIKDSSLSNELCQVTGNPIRKSLIMGPIYEITRAVEKRKEDRCTTMKNIQCKKNLHQYIFVNCRLENLTQHSCKVLTQKITLKHT